MGRTGGKEHRRSWRKGTWETLERGKEREEVT